MAKLPDHLREFDDTSKARELIYNNTLNAVKKRFPVEDDRYRLELHDVRYDGPQDFSLAKQKDALMKNRQLRTPMRGKWRLVDKEADQVVDERDDVVMHVPFYTQRGTFIHNGNEYTVVNQSRLKPGVYVRRQRTGEIESQFNVRPGTGRGFRMHLEPKSGVFRMVIGQSRVPAYPVMKAMGVSDKALMKAWGPELLEANIRKQDKLALQKVYKRLAGHKADPQANAEIMSAYLRDTLPKFELDSDVVASTLGIPDIKGVTPDAIMRATQKMLAVSRGEEDVDDRDAPRYSDYYGIEDFFEERVSKDAGRLTQALLRKARRARGLKPVSRGALTPYTESLITGSSLSMPLEETNPLHVLEQLNRVTKLGEGGIGSAEAITDEARDVNPGQLGFIDPIAAPEGVNAGVDTRFSYRTFKGRDKKIYAEFRDPTTGEMVYKSPDEVSGAAIAYPGQLATKGSKAVVMRNGKTQTVAKKDVDLEVPSLAHMFYSHINLNPMPTGVAPARQFYGAKFWSQYLPLVKGETPLVDSLTPDGKTTFTEHYGRRIGTLSSKRGGVVKAVKNNEIVIEHADGEKESIEVIQNLPFNRMTAISYFPAVKPGDTVDPGGMVAHSNFTDKKSGGLNLGINLRTAIIPARGESYEDAYVISESAAKKLSTERLYGFDQENRHGVEISKKRYMSLFPGKYSKDQLERIGDDGVIKVGQRVEHGDPLILARGPKLLSSADAQLGKLHKTLRQAHTDKVVEWEHHAPGVVTDIVTTPRGAKVNVRSTPPVNVGDKLSPFGGLKGVVGKVIADDEMPRDPATNQPYELMLNPMGIQSRIAPNQLIAIALGKLAKATGQQIKLPQERPPEGWYEWAQKQMDEAGISPSATIFDPVSGKSIENIGDGYTYISPFHHLSEKKLAARGEGGGYTLDEQPAKGGFTGAKRFSAMDASATLAHGAAEVLKDATLIRGTRNEEYWKALRTGRPLPEPKTPFIYEKFLNTLKAGGINVVDKGDIVSIMPLTDDDVGALSKGAVKNSKLLDSEFEPIAGGLFDRGKAGGASGNRWTHVNLIEPMPNPVMEEPVRRVLGLTAKGLLNVITGREEINGLTGGAAIQSALENVDIDKEIAVQKRKAKTLRGANRDNAIKVLGYLSSAKKTGIHPSKWVISKVPVLPPVFRPVSRMGDMALQTNMNDLYSELIETNDAIRDLRKDLPEAELAANKEQLYQAVHAAYGLGESISPEGQAKRLKGAIRQIIGRSPKTGMFQSKVLSKTVGGVARAVGSPNPNLDMDQVGIPEDAAWELYKDFVQRKLVRNGYPPVRAAEHVENRTREARSILDDEMKYRPVLMDRAPTWHKFNLLAFHPQIVEGNTIQVSPLVTKGFTMDFDGDTMNFHVPTSDKAVSQAKRKMMPSKNLLSLTDLQSVRHAPSMEMTMGLYWLTQKPSKKEPRVFLTAKDAKKAYARGEIKANDPIEIMEA